MHARSTRASSGCSACTIACKAEHEIPVGVNRCWVKTIEKDGRHFVFEMYDITNHPNRDSYYSSGLDVRFVEDGTVELAAKIAELDEEIAALRAQHEQMLVAEEAAAKNEAQREADAAALAEAERAVAEARRALEEAERRRRELG